MKRNIIILSLALLAFTGSQSFAQWGAGANLTRLSWAGDASGAPAMMGLGLFGEYEADEKLVYSAGINFYFPSEWSSYTTTAYALASDTDPSRVDVDVSTDVSVMHIIAGGKYYFVGEHLYGFSLFGIGEAGLLMATVSSEVGDYNQSMYTMGETSGSETVTGLTIGLGIGAEMEMGPGALFGSFKLNLPATSANDVEVDVVIPTTFTLDIGYRISFDNF